MAVTGLFAGIGGFELAFSRAGFPTSLLVEIDPAARAVLGARFPGVVLKEDVNQLTEVPQDTTILAAGFPCQNLSMAGDKTGINGSKSGVIEKMFELIERHRIPTVVIENVYFMLQLDAGDGMRWLIEKFEALNYRWAYRVVDTFGFGLPQRRRRVYLVASHKLDPRTVLFADNIDRTPPEVPTLDKPLGFYWTEGRSGVGFTVDGIPPLKVGSAVGIPSPPAVLFQDGAVLTPSITAAERLQGFPRGWTIPARKNFGRHPEWRLIGNAVSVPVARWVAQRIRSPGKVLRLKTAPVATGDKWPDACWNVGEGRTRVATSDWPVARKQRSISEFRDKGWTKLSDRALDGFIGRADEGNLRMPEGFLDLLRSAGRKAVA